MPLFDDYVDLEKTGLIFAFFFNIFLKSLTPSTLPKMSLIAKLYSTQTNIFN
jgi:hypothetical protein